MHPRITVNSEPAAEPITLAEAKLQCRIDWSDEDDLVTSWIKAARRYVEKTRDVALVTQTLDITYDDFPRGCDDIIHLPRGPLQSITSITYVASDGTSTVLSSSNYRVSTAGLRPRVSPAYGTVWPTTRDVIDAVVIRQVCGFGAYTAVPDTIKSAMKLIVAHLNENRELSISGTIIAEIPMSAESLLCAELGEVYA